MQCSDTNKIPLKYNLTEMFFFRLIFDQSSPRGKTDSEVPTGFIL